MNYIGLVKRKMNRATDHHLVMAQIEGHMKTATKINHEFLSSLRIAAGYSYESLASLELLFIQRKQLAKFILEDGPSEQSKEAYEYMNTQIANALGLLKT